MGAWLSQKGVRVEERDFFRDPFTEEEFRALLAGRPVAEFFAWRSPSFRRLGLDREALDDETLISLMVQEPRLIRRPLVQAGDRLVAGADMEALEGLLAESG